MRWVVSSSVRLAVVVLVVVGLILAGGVVFLARAPVDTLPELLPPRVQVQSSATGLSAGEAEQFLAVPAENELATVAYLKSLTSRSVPGLTAIDVTFKPGTSVWIARQLVSERMAQVPLPVDVGIPPVLIQPLSSSSRAMMIGLSSNVLAPIDLTTLARWRIRPRLLAVPGVANVTMWGDEEREMLVLLDPAKMSKFGVTSDQVMATVGDSMWTSPLTFLAASSPGADGLIDTPNQRLTIQHILPIITSKDLSKVPIEGTAPRNVTVGDVSTVIESYGLLGGKATVTEGGAGLVLVIEKLPGADTLGVTRGVDAALAELQPGLTGITVDATLFRPGDFIANSLRQMGIAGLIALVVACVWIGVAYASWRAGLTAAVSIVAALLAACLVLFAFGTTFNVAILLGLVMAIGVIVDDAVVGAVAVRKRLEAASASGEDVPNSTIVVDAFVSGRKPIGFTFAALVLASAPFFFVAGVAGTLSVQMIVAYLVALLASAVVSATVAPALAFLLMPARSRWPVGREGASERSGREGASSGAGWAGLLAAFAVLVVVVSVAAALLTLPNSYVPSLRDGSLVVHWKGVAGTSLDEMQRITDSAEAALRGVPGVRTVTSHSGQALEGDQIVGADSAATWLTLAPDANYGKVVAGVRKVLNGYPGVGHKVESYADNAVARANAGSTADLQVRVYGPNAALLSSSAEKVRSAIASVPGVANTRVSSATAQPLIQVKTDIARAARYGLKPGDIRRQAAALVGGILVGSYYKDQQVFDVAVWGADALRQNPGDISNLPIFAADGTKIPLKAVASVSIQPSPSVIDHEKASRYLDVSADVRGASAGSVVAAVEKQMRATPLPLGYHTEVSSPLQQNQRSDTGVALVALAAAVGIYLLLQAALSSWRRATLVFVLLPFAVSGSVLAAAIFGWGLTLGVVAGIVCVLGIALRNSTMLVHRFETAGDSPSGREESRILGSVARSDVVPVVMTAGATAILVIPFLVLGNVSGTELLKPFSAAVIAGLVTSTPLTLFILPALYRRWGVPRSHGSEVEGAQS